MFFKGNNMLNKISKSIIVSLLLVVVNANAVKVIEGDGNKNTHNEIDDKYQEKLGWDFYFDKKPKNKKEEKQINKQIKKAEMNLLQKILDENRKQTKIQNKILALLQKQIDPKPKIITVNGKKCVANSSAECFDYGSLIVAEAKKVPVMKKFLTDPYDVTKAARYLQWQAKYFKHVINIGNSLQFAYAQFGEKAYPIGAHTTGYSNGGGAYSAGMLPNMQRKLILSKKKEISYSIFIGKNITQDIYSALAIVNIVEKYGTMNIELVFLNKKSKDVFMGAISSVFVVNKIKNWKNVKLTIDPAKFKRFHILTTPSYVIKLDKNGKKEAQTLAHGKITVDTFRTKTIDYFEFKKLIDYSKYTEQNAWKTKEGKAEVERFFKAQHGVSVEIPKEK